MYNDSFQTIKLEIKYKKDNRVYKKTQPITQEQMKTLLAGECLPVHDFDRVVEVKYDEFLPGFISGLLETGNMNQTSYSKYRICREAANK